MYFSNHLLPLFTNCLTGRASKNSLAINIEGYLVILEKKSGKIIRATDIFDVFKTKKRKKISPIGFIVAKNNIYLSTSNGRLLLIDYITGRTKAAYKIDNGKISNPIILGKSFYLAKESSIIRLN